MTDSADNYKELPDVNMDSLPYMPNCLLRIKLLFMKQSNWLHIYQWIKSHHLLGYLMTIVLILYVIMGYEEHLIKWYDANIIKYLSKIKSNLWLELFGFACCLFVGLDIADRYKKRFVYKATVLFALAIVATIVTHYRFSGAYECLLWFWHLAYIDIFLLSAGAYIIFAIVNFARRRFSSISKSAGLDEENQTCSIIPDWPILSLEEDALNYKDEVGKIVNEIKNLDKSKTWSLAITAPWGVGKTSFINMVIEKTDQNAFDVVCFNPRDSKSYQFIQEDFFTTITNVLSKYDSKCNGLMKDYMASLQLIDNRQVVEKIINLYKIWNKDEIKTRLTKVFENLKKRILVIIDDFDRLSKEEILEVLKLIDGNAAFNNLIFFTAYDKEQVNKILGEKYQTEDARFVDKFFNLEFSIPSRPYSYISTFIEKCLCKVLNVTDEEKQSFKRILTNRISLFQEYVPTLRDAKRFVNQMNLDYRQVQGEVNVEEYMLVQLIKYKYPQEYKALYGKEYIKSGSIFLEGELWHLKPDIDEKEPILPILKMLFPNDENYRGAWYRHIYDRQSFDNYFVNQIYGSLRIGEMANVFYKPINEVRAKIDAWSEKDGAISDFIAYLNSFDMDDFKKGSLDLRYAEVIVYLATKHPQSRAYWMLLRLIHFPNIEEYESKYGFSYDEYKGLLLSVILNTQYDSNHILARLIHMAFVTYELNPEEELIKDEDLWPVLKSKFLSSIGEFNESDTIKWLYDCACQMELPSRRVILDSECASAYRKHIQNHPKYYLENFVRLGGISSSPDFNSIACEPFWKQIFGGQEQFEAWLVECKNKSLEYSERVGNFWLIYQANGCKPIEFKDQGNVQDKIDKGLEIEVNYLKRLRKIQEDVSVIPDTTDCLSVKDKQNYQDTLRTKLEELDEVKLYISLNGEVRKEIESKLEIMI